MLADYLAKFYGAGHEVIVYEAGFTAAQRLRVRTPLGDLAAADVTAGSTLYVPAQQRAALRPEMAERLGISTDVLTKAVDPDW